MGQMGGSSGFVSAVIAEAHPDIHFIVQDLEDEIPQGKTRLPSNIIGRIQYQAHDFFTPQLSKAEVYLYRYILHNWSDDDSVRILRALRPALRPGARLMIVEIVEGEDEVGQFEKKTYRYAATLGNNRSVCFLTLETDMFAVIPQESEMY